MTTIMWDGEAIYTDSQLTAGNAKSKAAKVFKISTPSGTVLAAFAGDRSLVHDAKKALEAGESLDRILKKGGSALIVSKHSAHICSDGSTWRTDAPVFMGSGGDFAAGAYEVCEDGRRAVEVACKKDLYSSGPVVKYRLR